MEASQTTTTVRTSQCRSNAEGSQPPTKKSRPSINEWEPDFRNQYESFKVAASNEQRKLIWKKWTKHQRSLVYAVSTVARRRLMDTWRAEEPDERGFAENSWVRDQTQDGDVHKNPGPSDRPMHEVRRKGVNDRKSGSSSTTSRWRHERQPPRPNPTARQARASRAAPGNREQVTRNNNKEDTVRQPPRDGSRHCGPKTRRPQMPSVPAHRRASGFEHTPVESHYNVHTVFRRYQRNANSISQRRPNRSTGCRWANQTYAEALRQGLLPPPRNGRSHPFQQQRHSRELFQAPSAHSSRGACVCVAGRHHATPCRVDLHGVVTPRVLRGQRTGPLHLSIGPAMIVRKDRPRRCGNTM